MNHPTVSIITPVFNGKRFIEACINNVIDQRCDLVEHIIVDGGSDDGTVDVIREYARHHTHIAWISEKDAGQSDAMNKGIAIARGSILGVLNTDDFYEPNVLNRIAVIFKGLPEPSLLVGNCNIWDDDGRISEINRPTNLQITDLMMGWHINPYPTNPSQYFYHASLHDTIGLYDVHEHFTLDIDFLSRAVQAAHVCYVDEVWGNYRKIAGTKTVTDIENGLCDKRFLATLEKYRKQLPFSKRMRIAAGRMYYFFRS